MTTKKTLVEKIAELRTSFAIAKGGRNAHGGYDYYKIDDFYQIKNIMHKLGVSYSITSDIVENAKYPYNIAKAKAEPIIAELPMLKFELTLTDGVDSSVFSFVSPFQSMKGMSTPAQEAGSLLTYATKYLLSLVVMADDGLSDPDRTENTTPEGNEYSGKTKTKRAKPEIKEPTPEDNQQEPPKNSNVDLGKRYSKHFSKEIKKAVSQNPDITSFLKEYIKSEYNKKSSTELTVKEMKEILDGLQQQGYEVSK